MVHLKLLIIHLTRFKKFFSTTSQLVMEPTFLNTTQPSLSNKPAYMFSWYTSQGQASSFHLKLIFHFPETLEKQKKMVLKGLWNTVYHASYVYSRPMKNIKSSLKTKWTIQFCWQEKYSAGSNKDYDDYRTPDTRKIDAETSFTEPTTTEATSTLQLRQKVKRDKLSTLYTHFNVTGNLDLIDIDKFRLTKHPKKESQFLSFKIVIDGFL